jgi:hypothetical protein
LSPANLSAIKKGGLILEHVLKKLIGIFYQNMLQLFDSERFLFDQTSLSLGQALYSMLR